MHNKLTSVFLKSCELFANLIFSLKPLHSQNSSKIDDTSLMHFSTENNVLKHKRL